MYLIEIFNNVIIISLPVVSGAAAPALAGEESPDSTGQEAAERQVGVTLRTGPQRVDYLFWYA